MTFKVCQLCAVDFTLKHFLTALIEGMHAEGWQITSVCSDGPYVEALRQSGYQITTVPIARSLHPFKHALTLFRLVRLFRREKFDVVHVHTPVAALLGRVAARIVGVPLIVYTAHGFYFHDDMPPISRSIFMWLEKMGGRWTDLLFTQSEEDARTAVTERFLPAHRVLAIGNGVPIDSFNPDDSAARARIREEFGVPPEGVLIGIIGRMVAEKGYREFLQAAEALTEQGLPVWFVAVGERLTSDHAAGFQDVLEQAKIRIGNRLILVGLRSDVPDLLAAMDIFTLPSYREGMPRTIIEAMLMRKPVVATNIRGAREEVIEGETGLLVAPKSTAALAGALKALAADPDMRARMGDAGRKRALALYDESLVVRRQIVAIRDYLASARAA